MFDVSHHSQLIVSIVQDKRKRLGQFFTGEKLARLLSALSQSPLTRSVIDPMCGTGDMLKAVLEFNPEATFAGIEIDREVLKSAATQFKSVPRLTLIQGNAFDIDSLQGLNGETFDLVITNPPYVRYQSLADLSIGNEAQNTSKIRQGLLRATKLLLPDTKDQILFSEIINSYSGLSDLAVPSWILCAMLTRVGGTLALVVPESWLSRDYAHIIHYILLRWFRIRYVVEDVNASWFPGTLVKTTLLVADRIERKASAFSWTDEVYAHVRISAGANNSTSVIGNAFPHEASPERAFARELEAILKKQKRRDSTEWSIEPVLLSAKADNLKNSVSSKDWLKKCEEFTNLSENKAFLPIELRHWLDGGGKNQFTTLDQLGVSVGQGLRTGANSFFYVTLIEENKTYAIVTPHKLLGMKTARVPLRCLRTVLHRQSELPNGYQIDDKSLNVRVMILRGEKLTGDLEKLIRRGQAAMINGKPIPELSAVRTNIRAKSNSKNQPVGWFVLPALAPRHCPMLLIPRVNGTTPKTYLNASGVVVDANFSTLWLNSKSILTQWALLALLNSSWSVASMELMGSVMGGGALKLEATHLKKMPLPLFSDAQIKNLDILGRGLAKSNDQHILRRVDEIVMKAIFNNNSIEEKLNQLRIIIERRRAQRRTRA